MNPPVEPKKDEEKVDTKAKASKEPAKKSKAPAKKVVAKSKAVKSSKTSVKAEKPAPKKAAKLASKDQDVSIELQYAGKAIPYTDIIDKAKEISGNKGSDLKIYIKPEENRVYYVSGDSVGSFEI